MLDRLRDVCAVLICAPCGVARRAPGGPSEAEPGADAGPAAPQAPPCRPSSGRQYPQAASGRLPAPVQPQRGNADLSGDLHEQG